MKTTSYVILGTIAGTFLLVLIGMVALAYFAPPSSQFIISNDNEVIFEPEEGSVKVIISEENPVEIIIENDTAQGH